MKQNPYIVPFIIYLIILASIIGLYKWNPPSPILIVSNKIQTDWSHDPIGCWESFSKEAQLPANCELDQSMSNILLFGDSHAIQLVFGFENMVKKTKTTSSKKIILLTSSLMDGYWRSPLLYDSPQVEFINSMLAKTTKNDVIIFSVTSQHVEDNIYGQFKQKGRLEESLAKLLESILYAQPIKGKIILMLDTPHLKNNVTRICSRENGFNNKLCKLEFSDYALQNSRLIGAYEQLKTLSMGNLVELKVLDPTPFFCKFGQCSLFDESGFMLKDGNHIKRSVSYKLIKELFFGII